jgi:ABC-2 type transport system ATP-binding protein
MGSEASMDTILEIKNLHKRFGKKAVLEGLDLSASRGQVYGLVGKNGEGKTTLIRILMGIIPADSGSIVYQGDRVRFSGSAYKRTIGYIPEDPFFYDWMTVGGLLGFNRVFFPRWNQDKAIGFLESFGLDRRAKVRSLSRGMKLKLGFVLALASEPELLVLDDPTSGLDVPTRHDFLRDVIRELASGGTTVFFATHLVHELERIVDRLGILHGGRLILEEDFEAVKGRTRRVVLTFASGPPELAGLEGLISERRDGRRVEAVVHPWTAETDAKLDLFGPVHKDIEPMSLEEIFVSFVAESPEPSGR